MCVCKNMRYFLFSGNVFDAALLAVVTALKNCKKKNIICDTLFLFCFFFCSIAKLLVCCCFVPFFFSAYSRGGGGKRHKRSGKKKLHHHQHSNKIGNNDHVQNTSELKIRVPSIWINIK